MANPMKIRATNKDGITEIKILMNHEMETGQRKDASGGAVLLCLGADSKGSGCSEQRCLHVLRTHGVSPL